MSGGRTPLKAIIGPGRSGTTWAGALVDSSPNAVYRFEPFRRMSTVEPEFRFWFDRLKQKCVSEDEVPRIYSLLCRAHPFTNKPPFFPEKSYALRSFGRRQLWPVAKVLRPIQGLYGALYSPPPGAPVVFKEVTFVKPLQNLIERTSVRVVYLVRHPCATVLSDVRGQLQGKMPSQRQQQLGKILAENAPELAERFADVVRGNDIVRRTALLWRFEVESCVPCVRQSANGMLLTYEQLADETYSAVERICSHFDLEFADQTLRFIQGLHDLTDGKTQGPRRTGFADKYFSIYRNPKAEKNAWKSKISAEDQHKIEEIVQDSSAVAFCGKLGGWW